MKSLAPAELLTLVAQIKLQADLSLLNTTF
jgi:hypothetical protein